ncbi:MAG: hypothetical protein A2234_05320 [Elusimicrobia bacterium RIFOXYA2_FULL_58_8]|nr:MAG: hypothetical protein A2285_01980 [Elusimicrobia bacterium RIFOXYA12_FULL_57_11]OGS15888.1 MAG: hypothetical protein A2234_05320 [Elusimicrobia bacterium RIFOXYA2_FULL_58_8]
MKNFPRILTAVILLAAIGCTGGRRSSVNPAYETEVVEAEGMAPVIDNDTEGAKKTSLAEAMKSALGLVVGIYISQDSLVAKSVLIDESITSQTAGYIEKYEILKERLDGDFYKTRIRAHVRKEDLASKLRNLESEPEKLGNPVIGFEILEFSDAKPLQTKYAETELKARFAGAGFLTGASDKADIIIKGDAETSFNTREGLGGFISYRAGISLSAVKNGSQDALAAVQESAGGIDLNETAAARASIISVAKKAADPLKELLIKSLREKSIVRVNLAKVATMNDLSEFVKMLRNIPMVRDSWVRGYTGGLATLDVGMRKGGASDLSQLLMKNIKKPVKINRASAYELDAELQ